MTYHNRLQRLRPLITLLAALPLSAAPSAIAQDARIQTVSLTQPDADEAPHYKPFFSQWYETIMPGETLPITLPPEQTLLINGAVWTPDWRAPSEAQTLDLELRAGFETAATLKLFVLEPHSNIDAKGWLNGYRIGTYPRNAPEGFIRLDGPEDRDHDLSPHFKLGQFLCKQQANHWPKYVLVSQDNVRRLEALLTSLNDDKTTDAETFFVMSGFRTPFYNSAIGSAKFSRHMYGDAADIYVDYKPRNGNMDDLNRDGKVNKSDANWLYDYAQKLYRSRKDLPKGGIGSYKANAVHGPFIHVDGRGREARWGRG